MDDQKLGKAPNAERTVGLAFSASAIKSFNTGSRNRLHQSATSSGLVEDDPCCHLAGTTTASIAISRVPLPTQEAMVRIAKETDKA